MDFTYPDFEPWSKSNDCLWITMQSMEIDTQIATARAPGKPMLTTRSTGPFFKFLAPREIQFNVDHSWEPYENITSRLANAIATAAPTFGDLSIFQNIGNTAGSDGKVTPGTGWVKSLSGKMADVMGTNVAQYRPDAPLVYKNSSNLEYVFEFDFAPAPNPGGASSITRIMDMVKQLLILSSPSATGFVEIKPPYVFTVRSMPSDIINIKYAALKTIQPVYKIGRAHV